MEYIQNTFQGMSGDKRGDDQREFFISENYDISKKILEQYPDAESFETYSGGDVTDRGLVNFAHGTVNSNTKLYSLGHISTTPYTYMQLYQEGSSEDWESTGAASASEVAVPECFFIFDDSLVGMSTNGIWTWKSGGSVAAPSGAFQITAALAQNARQGFVGNDGYAYIPYDKYVARLTDSSTVDSLTLLTFPGNVKAQSSTQVGDLHAYGVNGIDNTAISGVYLWNPLKTGDVWDTLQDYIPIAREKLWHVGNVLGDLVIVTTTHDNSSYVDQPELRIRKYINGGKTKIEKTFKFDEGESIILQNHSQNVNDKLFFHVDYTHNGESKRSMMVVQNINGKISATFDKDNEITGNPYGFFVFEDVTLTSHYGTQGAVGLVTNIRKTDITTKSYNTTAYIETQNITPKPWEKQTIESLKVGHAPLPSGGNLTVKVKQDAESSFTTAFVNTEVDEMVTDAQHIADDSDAYNRFGQCNEAYVRIESTGNVKPTLIYAQIHDDEISN